LKESKKNKEMKMSFGDLFEEGPIAPVKPRGIASLEKARVKEAEWLSEKLKYAPTIEFMHELPDAPDRITYEDFPFNDLNIYAGVDCIATSGILGKLWGDLTKTEMMKVPDAKGKPQIVEAPAVIDSVVDVEMPAHEFILDLEINGIGYSVARNEFITKKMTAEIEELDARICESVGRQLDMNSGAALAKYLYEERGFDVPFKTKKGEPAVDGNAFLTIAGLDPMGKSRTAKDPTLQFLVDMAKRRDLSSVRGTFLSNYVKDFVKRDGRVHSSYNAFGTSGFRISGDTPNLTQLPRSKHGYNIRTCYTTRPGYVFISFDFSSAEVKILSAVSKEPTMLRAIQDGLDFHTFSASSMRGIPYDEMMGVLSDEKHEKYREYKELRQLSKVLE
jgi:DNA polymerase-1